MPDSDETLSTLRRMNRLLALVAVKDVDRKDAVILLTRAGYSQAEIGGLLEMKLSAVSMVLVRHRRGSNGKNAKKAMADGDGE